MLVLLIRTLLSMRMRWKMPCVSFFVCVTFGHAQSRLWNWQGAGEDYCKYSKLQIVPLFFCFVLVEKCMERFEKRNIRAWENLSENLIQQSLENKHGILRYTTYPLSCVFITNILDPWHIQSWRNPRRFLYRYRTFPDPYTSSLLHMSKGYLEPLVICQFCYLEMTKESIFLAWYHLHLALSNFAVLVNQKFCCIHLKKRGSFFGLYIYAITSCTKLRFLPFYAMLKWSEELKILQIFFLWSNCW